MRIGAGRWYGCDTILAISRFLRCTAFFPSSSSPPGQIATQSVFDFSYPDSIGNLTALASASNGWMAGRLAATPTNPDNEKILLFHPDTDTAVLYNLTNALDVAFDTKNGLWITLSNEPAVWLMRDPVSGKGRKIALTDAAPGTAEYTARISRAVRAARKAAGSTPTAVWRGDAFEVRLGAAGFAEVETLPMDGWRRGIEHSFRARRQRR